MVDDSVETVADGAEATAGNNSETATTTDKKKMTMKRKRHDNDDNQKLAHNEWEKRNKIIKILQDNGELKR